MSSALHEPGPPTAEAPPELQLVEFNDTLITGSLFDKIPKPEAAQAFLLTGSKEQRALFNERSSVGVLMHYLGAIGIIPDQYIDLAKVPHTLRDHPAFPGYEQQVEDQNQYRKTAAKLIHQAEEYLRQGVETQEDFILLIWDRSQPLREYSPILDTLCEVAAQSQSQTVRDAERIARILVLNEIDELDVDYPPDTVV